MKRVLSLALALVLALSWACSKAPEDEGTDIIPPETPTPIRLPTPTSVPPPTPTPTSMPTPEPDVSGINPLNGLPMDEDYAERRPLAVMYNNIREALPMHGISQADLIYEALAEGGITRIVGFYKNPSIVPRFGSIRSTRAYYLDIAQAHDAILMHAGGSPEAFSLISSRKLLTLDGTRMNTPFYRDAERRANKVSLEHTMFANGPDLEQTLLNLSSRVTYVEGYDPFEAFEFIQTATPQSGADAAKVSLRYSNYKTGVFDYDESDGLYYVSQYGKPMLDGENGAQVCVKNVLILHTDVKTIDSVGRLSTRMTGTGGGLFICNGKAEDITWSKDGPASPYVYTLANGAPLKLERGVSYINIAPADARIELS
ncbi:MAG: DUF3048 domain-containing protein [Oscillospiraceae bacterium]|nr:DUF3048 domain-containing protein [Oscillospiraceae bacterium]